VYILIRCHDQGIAIFYAFFVVAFHFDSVHVRKFYVTLERFMCSWRERERERESGGKCDGKCA